MHVTPELEQAGHSNEYAALFLAETFALLRRTPDAVRWLRICVTCGFVNYPFLAERDPFFAYVRGDASFQDLMQKVRERWTRFSV